MRTKVKKIPNKNCGIDQQIIFLCRGQFSFDIQEQNILLIECFIVWILEHLKISLIYYLNQANSVAFWSTGWDLRQTPKYTWLTFSNVKKKKPLQAFTVSFFELQPVLQWIPNRRKLFEIFSQCPSFRMVKALPFDIIIYDSMNQVTRLINSFQIRFCDVISH